LSRSRADVALVVLTLDAGEPWREWLAALGRQSVVPGQFLVIDSRSGDRTVELAREHGFRVHEVDPRTFDHGGTRQLALGLLPDPDFLVFMTQDAVLADPEALARIVDCVATDGIGAAYGRQLPRPGARPIEAHARLFNYPERSQRRSFADAARYGVKAVFFSDAFAAFRRRALEAVGGFPTRTIVGEDSVVAAKLLLAGWDVAYCAEARVHHSHSYSVGQELRRYFDMGVFHGREGWIRERFGKADGEGLRYVRSELAYLARRAPGSIPPAVAHTVAKLVGYKLGLAERYLPDWVKPRLSMQRSFWLEQ
jgi:rhamnosyltransferase